MVGLNSKKKRKDANYLMDYYMQGIQNESPPANWSKTIEEVKESLNWNPDEHHGTTFVNIASQVN